MIKLKIKYGNSQTDLRFPCTEKEMNAALERIHAEDVTPLELYVAEVIFPKELGCLQDRFVNLDEVNFLGKRMDSFFGDEEYQFYEAMKAEGFETVPDLINLSFNLNRYPLIQDISDMGKIGREYLLTVKGCLPADDADDPKYAEFGRELIRSGKGVFTEHGLLFVDENTPFVRDYDGQNFPAYVYDQKMYPLSGKLRCPECGRAFRHQVVNGTAQWICTCRSSGATDCQHRHVREEAVYEIFTDM